MPSLYIARQKSNSKKNGAICSFDRAVPLNRRNLAFYALGKFGVAQTGIKFKGGIRRQENFESAGVLQFDIDLESHDSALSSSQWKEWMGRLFDSFPYKVFAYASQYKGAHVFVVLKEEIRDLSRYLSVTRKMIAYMSSLIDSPSAHVDMAVKDGARMFFEGLECDDPENWVYENDGEPLDCEDLPDAPSSLSSPVSSPILDLVSEGNRNCSAYKIAHKCLETADGDELKAKRLYQVMTEGSTLPESELESCFESARKKQVAGKGAPQKDGFRGHKSAKAEAYEEIGERLCREFKKDCRLLEGEVGSLYLLRPLEGKNCGTAQRCSKEAYLDRRTNLCRSPEYSPELQ
ncbi:MAG: hypothetical protein IKS61_00455 [Aeriscardovia sp.]|nr:hypothetical protein [Aeriscardovia sp.]